MTERVEIRIEAVDAATNTFNEMATRINQLSRNVESVEANARKAGVALRNIKVDPITGKISYTASIDTSAAQERAKQEAIKLKQQLKESEDQADRLAKRGEFMRTMFANLTANLLASSLGVAADAAGKLVESLNSAGKFQTQSIAASQDIATNLNTPLNVAKDIVERSQIEIAKLAASLPGETEDYSMVFNSLSGSLAANFKGNAAGFEKAALDMTKRVSALAAIRGTNSADAGSQAMRFLAGTATWGESVQQDLFQKNPQLQRALRQVASEEGVTLGKWKELTDAQRYKIFNKALTLAAPDTLFDAFQGTYESVTQGIKTALIDPQMGIFGVLRKVDLSTGIKSNVLDQAAQSLSALSDLFGSLGKLGEKLGFSFDPMLALAETLNTFTGFIRGFDAALNSLLGGGTFDLGNAFGFDLDMLPRKINEMLEGALKWFENLDMDMVGAALGKGWATWVNSSVRMFANFDWFKFGQILGTGLTKFGQLIVSFLFNAITTLDWLGLITAVLNIPLDLLKVFFGAMVGTVMTQVRGVMDGIKNFFDMIADLFKKAMDLIPKLPGTPGGVVQAAANMTNPVGIAGNVLGSLNPFDIVDKLMGKEKPSASLPKANGEIKKATSEGGVISTVATLPTENLPSKPVVQSLPSESLPGKPLVQSLPQAPIVQGGQQVAFAPSVQINGAGISDPHELANVVMQSISSQYSEWSQQKLT